MSIVTIAQGTAAAPAVTDPMYGLTLTTSLLYADAGTSSTDAYSAALQSESHLHNGTRGIALGIIAKGVADGTWGPGSSPDAGAIGLVAVGDSIRGGTVFGANIGAQVTTTAGATCNGLEIDLLATANTVTKYGLIVNSTPDDTGTTTGTHTIAGSGATYTDSAYILLLAGGGVGCPYGLLTVKQTAGLAPIQSTGSLWRAGGFTVTNGLDWPDMTFSGSAIKLPGFTVSGAGALAATGASFSGQVTLSGTGSVLNANGATTQNVYYEANNTSGNLRLGIEGSTGGGNVLGSSAYATTLSTSTARSLQFGTNNNVRVTIDSAGNTSFSGQVILSTTGSVMNANGATTQNVYYEANNTNANLRLGIEGSTGGGNVLGSSAYATTLSTNTARSLQFGTNNNVRMTIDSSGNTALTGTLAVGGAASSSSDGSHAAYVPPVYTKAGAALASTTHAVFGSDAFAAATTLAITLSGAAAFASATSYQVVLTTPTAGTSYAVTKTDGSHFTITASTSNSDTVQWIALGS